MKKVIFERLGQEIQLRVTEAFMTDGFRVLVDKENCNTSVWVGIDGKNDRIFSTKEEAEMAVLTYTNKLLNSNLIKNFVAY